MPRPKKKLDSPVSVSKPRELPQSLTAGRSRRTIKPNPKYMNDEMLVSSAKGSLEENELSDEEYLLEFDNDDPEDSGLILRKTTVVTNTPQTDGQPKRRGRPPKPKPLEAPRTEPVKNLRKEVLKKMDYKTISISKSRSLGGQLMHDGRRKLDLTMDSMDTDSGDQDDLDEMEALSSRSNDDSGEHMSRSQKLLNPTAYKKHLSGQTILDRRGSGTNKSSIASKTTGGGTTEEDEFDDDEDFYNDSDAKMSEPEPPSPVKRPVGRPRKHPIKQISPFSGKVLLPGMKATSAGGTLKRKAMEMDDDAKHESSQSKMLRRSYGLKSMHVQNQSNEVDSDENDKGKVKQMSRAASFSSLPRGPGRPPKNAVYSGRTDKFGRLLANDGSIAVGNRSFTDGKVSKSPTITIVNVNDIMKMKSKSLSDVRRRMEEEQDSEDVSEIEEMVSSRKQDTDGAGDRPKTNNQLVATILERKRPIPLDNLQDVRKRIRQADMMRNKASLKAKRLSRGAAELLTEDEIVDFEDMLQKNIVSANSSSRLVTVGAIRDRGRASENAQNENYNKASKDGRYMQNNRLGAGKRTLQPPRILNATMKLGNNRASSKQSTGSGDNHYSIDLTDPDNNVKLVSTSENSPIKRMPSTVGGQMFSSGQRLSGMIKQGQMQRTIPQEAKKKRVTCYETWNVIHIKSTDSCIKQPTFALSMIGLGNIATDIKMPSEAWSLRTVLEKRKVGPVEGGEIFCGETQDNAVSEEDKQNYEPNRVMFRRKASTPGRFNVQYDRAVIFSNDTYTVNVDGQSCKLMAAPSRLETVQDIETLLKIVDYVDLKNGCVELIASARVEGATIKRVITSSKDIM
ncbi:uncharacterized protein LOC128730433 [Anopheles nili]|uniref:uncharacterized protein LOC128730433 n=1 Tax=Anopheles nili TaxID=185578 RepID=UPI00237C07D4|nr:uncharacterized protein LOC128730433 [Anopheles nili]